MPITLEQMPEKIVIAGKATFMVQDAIFMFEEARSRVVAIENRGQSVFTFLPYVDPTLDDKTLLEKNAGPEQIAPLNPDLVLLKSFNAGELGATLEEIGIATLYFDLETPEVFLQRYRHSRPTLCQPGPRRGDQNLLPIPHGPG